MLTIDDISKKFTKTSETTIKVKAWGGEVKVRELTLAEAADVNIERTKKDYVMVVTKTVYYALVEPAIPLDDLKKMKEGVFDGIKEIYDEINKSDVPGK
ncbi:hypothetical protein [Sulfurimonas sp. HSL-1716]|uniref:hypothetical protein n=1 Tax=Hydrocurvibacter sulfurireducens TaxID=3131937 RepID=UPI0031F8C515